jgi:hypothetical protein
VQVNHLFQKCSRNQNNHAHTRKTLKFALEKHALLIATKMERALRFFGSFLTAGFSNNDLASVIIKRVRLAGNAMFGKIADLGNMEFFRTSSGKAKREPPRFRVPRIHPSFVRRGALRNLLYFAVNSATLRLLDLL